MTMTANPAAESGFWGKNRSTVIFYLTAVILLFLNLWVQGISGSEGRWAEVVREMLLNHDFLHPTINGLPYFDKPLVSYWLIAFLTMFTGGTVNLLLIRIPSAVSALIVLWCTRNIAKETTDEKNAVVAGWIMLTIYSFAFWGRLGEADMLNLAFSTLAVTWYFRHRTRTDFLTYLGFGAICAIGGQTKGLSSIAVPVLVVAVDMTLVRRWKAHLNGRAVAAAIVSFGIYLLPFVLAMIHSGDYSANGLELVFRENILRYFHAFDHQQPWYAYFIHLPQLFLPWTPFLILALLDGVYHWKQDPLQEHFFLIVIAAIFIVFSISDSKRVYYILPILPYCAILTAGFLTRPGNDLLIRLRSLLLQIYFYGSLVLAAAAFPAAAVWHFYFSRKFQFPCIFTYTVTGSLILAALALLATLLYTGRSKNIFAGITASFALVLIVVFAVIRPVMDQTLRTSESFFRKVPILLQANGIPTNRLYYYCSNSVDPTYYLQLKHPIPLLDSEFQHSHYTDQDVRTLLKNSKGKPFAILVKRQHLVKMPSADLRVLLENSVIAEEKHQPWENRKRKKQKYLLLSPNRANVIR